MTDAAERLKSALADRYPIEREIGAGGMATVYLAHDVKHDRRVAVKVFRPELAAALGSERFFREIRITANLSHPHILPLLDSGTAVGRYGGSSSAVRRYGGTAVEEQGQFLYYVMPYVEGESLRDRLNREKQLPVGDALKITTQVASALSYAHSRDIVHRDIKPENILFQADEVVVADFGIALAVDSAGGTRLTETGFSLGTPAYMSPEQVSGDTEIDGRSDIYALACVLYEMLAGDPPFLASSPQAVLAKHVTEPAPSVTTVRPSVPQPVASAIARALDKARADRFPSAKEFSDALVAGVREAEPEIKSIVVLPFENLSPDPDNEYFSDGLTDELIADLSKLHSLRVISRNSAMQLKGTDKDTRTIGRELGVQYVLEGTVRRAGNRLRITAQLINAEQDAHLWTEKYDGVLEDVFDMQEQVSRSIVDALEVELNPSEQMRLAERPIQDVTALECSLRARAEVLQFTGASLDRALALLDRGLEIVGDNDILYAGKSEALLQCINTMTRPVDEFEGLLDEAKSLAQKALTINPRSDRAEAAMAFVCHQGCDPKGAVHHWTRAVELNPSDAFAVSMLGFVLSAGGIQVDRATEMCRLAAALDPLSRWTQGTSWVGWFACQFEEVLDGWREWQRQAEQQRAPMPLLFLAWLHAGNGNLAEASRLFELLASSAPGHMMGIIGSVFNHALHGEKEQMLSTITEQVEKAAWWDDLYAYMMAQSYALTGDLDRAAPWLDHAIDYGFCNPYFLEHEPHIENLRKDERFGALFEKAKRLSESLSD